jgi:hypothetical protein
MFRAVSFAFATILLANSAAIAQERFDMRKSIMELPLKRSIAPAPLLSEPATARVAPGKVKWHATFEDACAASRTSGKPVMLFVMMGNLDDKFC